jgi:hypothetical protein
MRSKRTAAGAPRSRAPRRRHHHERRIVFWNAAHHRDGHRIPARLTTHPVRDDGGTIIGAIATFADESSLEAMRARLREMEELAMVDPLTEIPNRR